MYAPAGQLHLAAHVLETLHDPAFEVLVHLVQIEDHLHVGSPVAQLLLQLIRRQFRVTKLLELIAGQLGDHQGPL